MNLKSGKTKIVCTLGPASDSKERLRSLAEAGMDVVRLNFSHGTHDEHRLRIQTVREVSEEVGKYLAILQDLSGPKIRTGTLADGPVELEPGKPFVLTARDVPGDAHEVSLTFKELVGEMDAGDTLLLADGAMELRVEEVKDTDIVCRVIVGGALGSNKGINVPTKALGVAAMTEKDHADLKFGLKEGVDWVALSFVRSGEDVYALKKLIRETMRNPVPVMAKIEKAAAVEQLDEILFECDGVMVARGDLGVEIPMHEVPWVQKTIIERANLLGIPVVTATQMLESMIENPRPTRAEMTDIANAILDGTDAIMLSAETAVGKYPVEAVHIMNEIAGTASRHLEYPDRRLRSPTVGLQPIPDAICRAACDVAVYTGAELIICCTRSGQTARGVAKYRPPMPVIGVSHHERVLRQIQLNWGTVPVRISSPSDTDDMIAKAKRAVLNAGLGRLGDKVVIVAGIPLDVEGTTNMVKADVL